MKIQRKAPEVFKHIDPLKEIKTPEDEFDNLNTYQMSSVVYFARRNIKHLERKTVFKVAKELNTLISETINLDIYYKKNEPDYYYDSDTIIVHSQLCLDNDDYCESHSITESELFSILALMEMDLVLEYNSWLDGASTSPIRNQEDVSKVWKLLGFTMVYAMEAIDFAKIPEKRDIDLKELVSSTTKQARRDLASKAGKSKAKKNEALKDAVIQRAKIYPFKSAHHAAETIWNEIQTKPSDYPLCHLTKTRGKATIYEWIRKAGIAIYAN